MAATLPDPRSATPLAILAVFTRLGLTSFGGPIAHLGYFREEFVVRRRWLSEPAYADLVALCQFLPGPASSQVGFALGSMRGGIAGGLAAWLGFTWPSALVLLLFAYGAAGIEGPVAAGLLHGLMLVAVAVVAQAVLGMAQSMCPDPPRATIAVLAIVAVSISATAVAQIAAIILGAVAGLVVARLFPNAARADGKPHEPLPAPVSRRAGAVLVALVPVLLALLWFLATTGIGGQVAATVSAFYRSGALVFGGGHVILPMLDEAVVASGWVSEADFLAGYGAAQAVPGPLFTFAAYLGALGPPPDGVAGAAIALVAIFLPGLLLVLGSLPWWEMLRRIPSARAALAGINAAVFGILGAALYDPVWIAAVGSPTDFAVVAAAFTLLVVWQTPPVAVVALAAGLRAIVASL